jgi:hypothetical protein
MLYLRNTNQIQSLAQQIERGGVAALTPGFISASYTTNTASLFIITNDATTKLSTTASATTNFSASANSIVSASVAGTAISSSNLVTLFVSASDGSLYYSASSTGSALMTNFAVGSNVRYTISSSVYKSPEGGVIPTGNGLFRTQYIGYFMESGSVDFFNTYPSSSAGVADTGVLAPGFTSSVNDRSVQWLGYFKASSTENYTFFIESDDACLMWLGDNAINNYTTSSVTVGTGSFGPNYLTSSAQPLISGTFYPMRIQWGEKAGAEYMSMSFSASTVARTFDFTNYSFYNTSSNGI